MYTLGINAVYHDCAAALVRDGEVVAAAEEERFTHIKHGKRPLPFTTWDPLFLSYIVNAPRQLASGAPHHLQERFRGVRHDGPFKWHYVEHHLAHEASAFLAAPFEECAVLTMDGRGERPTTSYGKFTDRRYQRIKQVWVQPAAGDAGTALGAALWIDAAQQRLSSRPHWHMNHAFLGPAYNDAEIENVPA